tara:strand:- start:3160 stop:7908 length:4749 start_codon:yes stop_codon:yes gene_type:complete
MKERNNIVVFKRALIFTTIAIFFFLLGTTRHFYSQGQKDSSFSKANIFKKHILSLDYISRKTASSKFFLNMAKKYCDSLIITGQDSAWAEAFKEKIDLTIITCEFNMNHVVQLFPYFNSFPSFMGFADDAIEYAYDNTLNQLFNTTFKKIHNEPLSEANICSIVVRRDCDDEMFEIVKQTIMGSTNHFILTNEDLEKTLGIEKTNELTNGVMDTNSINKICKLYELENLGIFDVSNLDNIDEKIWLVESKFNTYSVEKGFTEAVFTRGFCQDKRGVLGLNIILLILESILFIAFIAVFDENIIKYIRTKKLFSFREAIMQTFKKIKFVSICFIAPTILSFLMINAVSVLIPGPTDHYMESSAIIWLIALTLGMSIIPTFLNLFLINRLQIDGFHNIRGYRTFANASLYATYLPLFVFYIIQFENHPWEAHFLLVVLTFVIADLLARSYFQFTSKSKHQNLKSQAIAGLIVGIIAMIFFNTYALTEISIEVFLSNIIFVAPLSIIHWAIGKYFDRVNKKKLESSTEKTLLSDLKFITDVINPFNDIYYVIDNKVSDSYLNIMLIDAPMGIGKTRSIMEAKSFFTQNNWNWHYGDCDEMQDENSVSFEPFLEAFKDLLNIEEFTDRSQHMENLSGDAVKAIADISGAGSNMISELKRDESRSMTEICIEILDKLEASQNKTVFIMEDLHWIDPESYAFLKHFIKTVNRSEFIRKNLCIVLTTRNDKLNSYRGVSSKKILEDLSQINQNVTTKILIENLLTEESFNVKDFISHVSNQNQQFKIQEDSLNDINYKLNNAINTGSDKFKITPLYVLKIIEQWIQNKVLKYTLDGYVLTESIETIELPNTDEIDSYYHGILDKFDKKWTRLLESAAIIGNKFNADILSQVWGYELLEIMEFLEDAEEKALITDLSDEDNIYEFKDKRITSAIKSYFPSSGDSGVKQIIIEYNKRYLDLQKNIIDDPSEFSVEEILSVLRRLTLMMSNSYYSSTAKRLIFEVVVRLVPEEEFDKISAFSNLLKERKLISLSELILLVTEITNPNTSFKKVKELGNILLSKNYNEGSVEQQFRIYGLMFKEKRFSSEFDNNDEKFLKESELEFISDCITNTYKGNTLLEMSFLYLVSVKFEFNEKIKFLENLDVNLSTFSDHSRVSLFIEHKKLVLTLKEKFENKIIDKRSKILLKKSTTNNDKRLIKLCLQLRLRIVTKYLNNKEDSISIYKDHINLLKTNDSISSYWVSLLTYFYSSWSASMYIKENPDKAQDDLDLCDEFISKRHDKGEWTELINDFIRAKKRYLSQTDQPKEYSEICKSHIELLEQNNLQNSTQFGTACVDLSDYYLKLKDYKNQIKFRLKQIETLEKIYENKSKPWSLKTAYSNISFCYRNYIKDYKKSTEFALKSLDVVKSSKAVPEHSILYTYSMVARSFLELNDFENATNYSLENMDRLNKSNDVSNGDLAASHNLLGINYKTIAEKIEDKPASIANYEKAMHSYHKAFSFWSEENLNQKFKRLRALLECKICESQIIFGNKKVKKPKINSLIDELNDALIEIKKPEISSLYAEGMLKKNIDKLIETAESTVLELDNLINKN